MRHLSFALVLAPLLAACAADPSTDDTPPEAVTHRVALLADSHVIGTNYECCESPGLDTQSIFETPRRLRETGEKLAAITPLVERAFVLGDVFHDNYITDDLSFYLDPEGGSAARTAFDIYDDFPFPVHYAWGNHDYQVPQYTREFAHEIFDALFGTAPYHAVDVGPFRFVLANTQLGPTWDPASPKYEKSLGSFGAEQLAWLQAQLADGRPTFLLFHHPALVLEQEEQEGDVAGLWDAIRPYADVVVGIYVGHTHRWLPLANEWGIHSSILGATRYDSDNFWILDLHADGTWEIVDEDKQVQGQVYGRTFDYATNTVDETRPAEDE